MKHIITVKYFLKVISSFEYFTEVEECFWQYLRKFYLSMTIIPVQKRSGQIVHGGPIGICSFYIILYIIFNTLQINLHTYVKLH